MRFIDTDSWSHDLLEKGHFAKVVTRASGIVYALVELQDERSSSLLIPTKAKPNTIGDLMATINRTVVGESDNMMEMYRNIQLEVNRIRGQAPGIYCDKNKILYRATSSSGGGGQNGVTTYMRIESDANNVYPDPDEYVRSLIEATGFQDIIPVALLLR
ncbi:MAG: hypothetical protein Q8L51_02110 [Candidatus Amesbacteria bacterium]|nr:hypothetical protein [Candidatus Amesbacteria bacterium]